MVDRYTIAWGINSYTFLESENGDLVKYTDYAKLESENKALKEDIKKAFWWSAENTLTIHANKIQAAWEDWNTYFRGK